MGGVFAESDMDSLSSWPRLTRVTQSVERGPRRKLNLPTVWSIKIALPELGETKKSHFGSPSSPTRIRLQDRHRCGCRVPGLEGAHVRAYDPVAIPEAKSQITGGVRYCDSAYAAAEGSDALVWATGWPEFARWISTASSTC